ncbi:hypothetical protein ASG90_03980 [Nocardioides sp. Soil797]|nr:hypothetical protein ASG90_03980 [Nocardioides sp. Soil797]
MTQATPTQRGPARRKRTHRHPAASLTIAPPGPGLTAEVVATYRPRADALSQRISDRISREVAAFTNPRSHGLIAEALSSAVSLFVDALAGAPTRGSSVAGFYRWLGQIEGEAGHDLDAMRAAHHIATHEVWEELRTMRDELGLTADTVGRIAHTLNDFQSQLLDNAMRGFAQGRLARRVDPREPLFRALVRPVDLAELRAVAAAVSWSVPATLTVAGCRPRHPTGGLGDHPDVITGTHRGMLVMIGREGAVQALARRVTASHDGPITISSELDATAVHHGVRWCARALHLIAEGVIDAAETGIVRCADHERELFLYADPELRRRTDEQLLAPLLVETVKQRACLAETMLVWLQTRDSAPAIAPRLGVHEQTVRLRLRKIRALFGDRLDDPKETVGLLSALESAAPRWRSEAAC